MTDTVNKPLPACPLGRTDCEIITELSELRQHCSRLEALLEHDALTGLFNYRFLINTLAREMERTRRTGEPLGLIMIDLDHFKRVNDSLGHEAGNCVIITAAEVISRHTRECDMVCRYGGDELAIILPATTIHRAVTTAERLRRRIMETDFSRCGDDIHITISAGIAIFDKDSRDTPEEFIKRSDSYLLMAKKDGKNCVRAPLPSQKEPETELTPEEKDALTAR